MGKLILCSGARTKRPYCFPSTGIRVYSIEELCHFLFHHIYLIEEELFNEALIDWIQVELKLPERAEKLRQLKTRHADTKTMVTVILCSADYYTEHEIKSYLKELDTIVGMPRIKRNCIKANNYLKQRQFKEAEAEYEKLSESKDAAELTQEDYGDILHNLAVAKLHTVGFQAAAELFEQAYIRNNKEESLRQYLFAIHLIGMEDLYNNKLEEYQVGEALRLNIEGMLQASIEEAKQSELMIELHNIRQLKLSGNINGYDQRNEELIEGWKTQIRQM